MSRGQLTASVEGTRRYNVRFRVEGRELDWSCTCPLGPEGEACKHVVAAGLAWLAQDTAVQDASTKDEPAVKACTGFKRQALRPHCAHAMVRCRDARYLIIE